MANLFSKFSFFSRCLVIFFLIDQSLGFVDQRLDVVDQRVDSFDIIVDLLDEHVLLC